MTMLRDRMAGMVTGGFRVAAVTLFAIALLLFPFALLYAAVRVVRMAWGG